MKNGIVEIGGLRFGAGLPKVCVPLVSPSEPGLKEEIRACLALPADLLEWRADCFFADPLDALPLVCREGGKACLTEEAYEELLWNLLERGGFSLLDVELSAGEDRVRRLAHKARERNIGLVVSRHDFEKTPGEEEMVITPEDSARRADRVARAFAGYGFVYRGGGEEQRILRGEVRFASHTTRPGTMRVEGGVPMYALRGGWLRIFQWA